MATPTAELGIRLLVYGVLLVAIPLSFVLLFRAIDGLAQDGLVEQPDEGSPEASRPPSVPEPLPGERVRCPQCGEENDETYTFCQSCQARIGG